MAVEFHAWTDPDGHPHPYDSIYFCNRSDYIADLFNNVWHDVEGIDFCQFVYDILVRDEMAHGDSGSPHHLCLRSADWERVLENAGYVYPLGGHEVHFGFPRWAAYIYVYMQWKFNLTCRFLAEQVPPRELNIRYPGLHTASVEVAGKKLMEAYDIKPNW